MVDPSKRSPAQFSSRCSSNSKMSRLNSAIAADAAEWGLRHITWHAMAAWRGHHLRAIIARSAKSSNSETGRRIEGRRPKTTQAATEAHVSLAPSGSSSTSSR